MRLVIQRVREASVTVGGEVVGSIGRGLVVLCGLERSDDQAAAEWAERRICGIRLFENADDKAWAASVASAGLEVLLVSQFTLLAVLKWDATERCVLWALRCFSKGRPARLAAQPDAGDAGVPAA